MGGAENREANPIRRNFPVLFHVIGFQISNTRSCVLRQNYWILAFDVISEFFRIRKLLPDPERSEKLLEIFLRIYEIFQNSQKHLQLL
jgi:hypothetical protein